MYCERRHDTTSLKHSSGPRGNFDGETSVSVMREHGPFRGDAGEEAKRGITAWLQSCDEMRGSQRTWLTDYGWRRCGEREIFKLAEIRWLPCAYFKGNHVLKPNLFYEPRSATRHHLDSLLSLTISRPKSVSCSEQPSEPSSAPVICRSVTS
jgi:hypothetical protein